MTDPPTEPSRAWTLPTRVPAPTLGRLAALALALRVVAADLVQWRAQREGALCLFPDTFNYWLLAEKLVHGEPYEILDFADLPRFSLRTPGYPLFLAACQWLFGPRTMPVRLVQSALGAACVGLVALLARLAARNEPRTAAGPSWSVPILAAALVAVEPFVVANSAVLLSEALFLPLMLLAQCGFGALWGTEEDRRARPWVALLTGAATAATVLTRPAWLLFGPAMLAIWVVCDGRRLGRRRVVALGALLVVAGFVGVMAPWWARNYQVYGRFVPTALWSGASLYDGLSPTATGASDMDFLDAPDVWPLGEEAQDAELSRRAWAFARSNPGRAARLAVIKAGRFWSPWPNAEGFFSPAVAVASAAVTLPVFALIAVGAWDRRRDPRALAVLALPLLYTFALHLVFVSSMRYRVPVIVPAFVLAGIGARRIADKIQGVPGPEGDAARSLQGLG